MEEVYLGSGQGRRGVRRRVLAHLNRTVNGNAAIGGLIQHYGYARIYARWRLAGVLEDQRRLEVEALKRHFVRFGSLPRCNSRWELEKKGAWEPLVAALAVVGIFLA